MCQGRRPAAAAVLLSLLLAGPADAQKSSKARVDKGPRVKAARIYQDPAFARGEADGFSRGADDGRKGERYDPARHAAYRDGDGGYAEAYGPRAGYKTNYRDGFRKGYEEGYRKRTRAAR
jgi:hypothetical protein